MSSCPICNHQGTICYSAGQYKMYRCCDCKTAFCFPTPSDSELSAYYANFHQSDSMGGVYDSVESRMNRDFPSKVQLIKSLSSGGKLLDVGCGKGYFVKHCHDAKIAAEGIDLSTTAVEFAVNSLGVPATLGRIEEVAGWENSFDTVTMWATIEHLPTPGQTLAAVHRVLKPNGILHLDTGIGFDWLDRLLPGVNQWYDPPQHLFVFSELGLKKLLTDSGFKILRYDRSFERSTARKVAKHLRSAFLSASFALLAKASLSYKSMKALSRFPLGNLQSVSVQKCG